MTFPLSIVITGLICISVYATAAGCSLHENGDEVPVYSLNAPDAGYHAYRRFRPEYTMWCDRGAELSVAFKTNLLGWLLVTPNAELELFWKRRWSVCVSGNYASWLFSKGERLYSLAGGASEFRWWLRSDGKFNGHYLGVGVYAGQYDIQLSSVGKQGEYYGVGVSYGYGLQLTERVNLEFGLTAGYTLNSYEKYVFSENEFISAGNEDKNGVSLNRICISLVWHVGNERRGKRP